MIGVESSLWYAYTRHAPETWGWGGSMKGVVDSGNKQAVIDHLEGCLHGNFG